MKNKSLQQIKAPNSNEKGIAFAADFLTATMLLFFCTLAIYAHINSSVEKISSDYKKIKLAENGIFLMDSLVKNNDENNPLMGSAYFNSRLKRVEQNVVDIGLLKKISEKSEQGQFIGFFVKSVSFQLKGREPQKIFEKIQKGTCIGIERFAILKEDFSEEKGKITAVVCNEK